MVTMTAKKVYDLNNTNVAAQRAQLGTLLMGGVIAPSVGTISTVNTLKYTVAPVLGTATYVHAAIALTASTQTVTTSITNPDVPRIVTIKGNASGNAGDVVITGTDFAGTALTETIALNAATEVLGTKAFKTVTSIDLPAETHAGTDTVSIGIGNKVGFPAIIDNTANVISKDFDGSVDAGTVTASTTIPGSIYAVAGTLNGVKLLELTFINVG